MQDTRIMQAELSAEQLEASPLLYTVDNSPRQDYDKIYKNCCKIKSRASVKT